MTTKTPTWNDILDQTFSKMRNDAIRMVDECIVVMEPLQRKDFEYAVKYDELLLLRKKAEAMPNNTDEAMGALSASKKCMTRTLTQLTMICWTHL